MHFLFVLKPPIDLIKLLWPTVQKSNLMCYPVFWSHMYLVLQAETKFYNGLLYYGEGGNL